MKIKVSSSGPKLTPRDLDEFEREIGFALPRDYRDFLVKSNGGEPNPSNFKDRALGKGAEPL